MIAHVPADKVRTIWPLVEPILRRAVDRTKGRFNTDDALGLIECEAATLWVSHPIRSVCVMELIEYPRLRDCRVIWAAGDLDEIKAGVPALKAWAKANGCASLIVEGRRGWLRALFGAFREEAAILRMEL